MNASQPIDAWVDSFVAATDADRQILAHGRHYTCTFSLDMETHRFVVRMEQGKAAEVLTDPPPLQTSYQFGLAASADTWRRMAVPLPAPMYHGIFAANAQRDLRFEGDLLVMMQNLRCFVRHVELIRVIGVPV